MNLVKARSGRGLNMDPVYLFSLGLVRRGPRWDIQCGACGLHYEARLPMVDRSPTECTHCHATNVLDVSWSRR